MALVHKETRNPTGSAVHVFVAAPCGEIDAPIVQRQLQVSGGVRQIKTDRAACCMTKPGDRFHLKGLPGVIVHPTKQDQCDLITLGRNQFLDVFKAKAVLTSPGLHLDHGFFGIKAVKARLACHGVTIGRKGRPLDEDFVACARRAIKTDHQEVQVGGQAVHQRNLAGLGSDDSCRRRQQRLVVAVPRVLALEVAFYAELFPVQKLLLNRCSDPFGLQP